VADTAPSFVADAAQTELPPKRRTGALALCTVLVVLLAHWWTLGEIATLLGPLGEPAQAPSDITSPMLTRTITLPPDVAAAAPPAAPAAPAPRPLEVPPAPPSDLMQVATSPAPALETLPVPAPLPEAQEPPPDPPPPPEPPATAPMPRAAASAPAIPSEPDEKVAAAPVPLPLPVTAPEPEREPAPTPTPTPAVPAAPPVPAPLPAPDAKVAESPAPAPKPQPEPAPAPVVPAPAPAPAAAPVQAPPSRPLVWPGSKVLAYQLEINSFPLPARAELRWRHDGAQYEASLALQSLISVTRSSKGAITPQGLEPLRYGEKITARGETAVHFQRDKGIVSFSNNKPSAVLMAGMQDEVSVFFQVAAMLGGSPQHFVIGTEIPLQTAESRAVRAMVFVVGKSEVVDLPGGRVPTIYLSHTEPPRFDGGRSSKGEIWAAPGLDYLPVRIRITEPSGTTYDLRWSQTLAP